MTDNFDHIEQIATVPVNDCGRRLDQVCAEQFPEFSRSRLQQWIKSGDLLVDGQQLPAKHKLLGGEELAISTQLKAEGGLAAPGDSPRYSP